MQKVQDPQVCHMQRLSRACRHVLIRVRGALWDWDSSRCVLYVPVNRLYPYNSTQKYRYPATHFTSKY